MWWLKNRCLLIQINLTHILLDDLKWTLNAWDCIVQMAFQTCLTIILNNKEITVYFEWFLIHQCIIDLYMFAVCGNDIQRTLTKLTAEVVLLNDFVSDVRASKSDLLQEVSHCKHTNITKTRLFKYIENFISKN